jgi:hypothetical protein
VAGNIGGLTLLVGGKERGSVLGFGSLFRRRFEFACVMGGVVARALQDDDLLESTGSFLSSHLSSKPNTVANAPSVSYNELTDTLLPICATAWNHLMTNNMNGTRLCDVFQMYVYDGLQQLEEGQGSIIEMLLKSSTMKNKSRNGNPIFYVMKYCLKNNRRQGKDDSEAKYVGSLQMLGRQHLKTGVSNQMIAIFCEILLVAVARCFDQSPNVSSIVQAWASNLKYIVSNMTNVRFSLLRNIRPTSRRLLCSLCGEILRGSAIDTCDDCVRNQLTAPNDFSNTGSDAELTTNSIVTVKSSKTIVLLPHDGLDHNCHTIPELVTARETKEASIRFRCAGDACEYLQQVPNEDERSISLGSNR